MLGRPVTGESLAAGVHAQLRIDILERRLTPGAQLKPAELAKRLGVSVNVTREALALLATHNLVRVERNRGFYVTTLSPEARTDLTAARKINEGAALRLAVERGGTNWQSEIIAAHHRMATQPMHRPDDPATRTNDWTAAHRAFHHTLIEAADNHVLLEICQRLSDAAQLHRACSDGDGSGRDVPAEHKALLDAALARQAERAVALFEAHIEWAAAFLLELETSSQQSAAGSHPTRSRTCIRSSHRGPVASVLTSLELKVGRWPARGGTVSLASPALVTRRRRLVLADLLPGARTRDAALVIGAAAFVGLSAQVAVSLPFTPVPLTMQPFAVLLAGATLGLRRGAAGMVLYVLAGLAGLPWFAQHHGGTAVVHAASFGYLLAYPFVAALVGALAARGGDRTVLRTTATMALGSLVIYAFGLPWLMATLHVGLARGLALGVTPFLAGDAVKVALAAGLLPTTWRLTGHR